MNRKEELLKVIRDEEILIPLVDEVLFLEEKLTELKKLPFLKVHPNNPELQKVTPAGKQYKELLQQYTNCIKVLSHAGKNETDDESPLRKWVKAHVET